MTTSLKLLTASAEEITVNKKEAFRYMGATGKSFPDKMQEAYSLCLEEFYKNVSYKACYRKTEVSFKGDGVLDLGFGEFKSLSLQKNLEGCKEAYIFVATCGMQLDRLIIRLSKVTPWRSVVTDAIGSSAIECFCDFLNEILAKDKELKPRFSCGYGDFDIKNQKNILDFLDAYRKVGISLSESYMMTPKKTVTAVVGIKRTV